MSSAWDWSLLFRTEGPLLVRFLRRFGAAVSAEDVAQESFARLIAAGPQHVASPRAFLFRTARNLAIDQVRRERASPVRPSEHAAFLEEASASASASSAAAPSLPSPEDDRIEVEERAVLEAAIAALSPDQRTALLLRRVEGLPPEVIATRLGVSVRQVQRLIVQALALLQAHVRAARDTDPSGR